MDDIRKGQIALLFLEEAARKNNLNVKRSLVWWSEHQSRSVVSIEEAAEFVAKIITD